ncbi:hypothetical protein [Thomasclavelia cocleata]|uniref:hypothetical protein n=1 Tax=Thomasclavelia cocleata TaxID=69824 RepID=UPI00255AD81D|nr:hypothetical protein [Thomasclavelia cocleata]
MIKVKWDLEEAVALCDLYFKSGRTLSIDNDRLNVLFAILKNRATSKGLVIDEKFRNVTGLKMQIGCIHYIATNGNEGLSNVSKVFYEAYDLYKEDSIKFDKIIEDFYCKYK